MGYGPLNRIYKAKDGWFYLVARDTEAIRAIPLLSGLPEDPETLSAALEGLTAEGATEAWVTLLNVPGVTVRRCRFYQDEPPEEHYAKAKGITKREFHPGIGMLRTTHGAGRLSLTPTLSVYPSPAPGADTDWFLAKSRKEGRI